MNYQSKYEKIVKKHIQNDKDKSQWKSLHWKILRNCGNLLLLNDKPHLAQEYFRDQLQQRCSDKKLRFEPEMASDKDLTLPLAIDECLILNNLALCYLRLSKHKQAETLLSFVIKLKLKLGIDLSATQCNLASLLEETGRADKALTIYEQTLKQVELKFGKASARAANIKHNIAYIKLDKGDPETALRLQDQAVEMFKEFNGPACSEIAVCLGVKAQALRTLQRAKEAIQALQTCLLIEEEYYGPRTKQALLTKMGLGAMLQWAGEQERALQRYQEVVNDGRSVFGSKESEMGKALFNLGSLLYSQCRLEQAQRYLEQARTVFLYSRDEQMQSLIDKYLLSLNQAIKDLAEEKRATE